MLSFARWLPERCARRPASIVRESGDVTESPAKALVRRVHEEIFGDGKLELIDELYVPAIRDGVRFLASALRTGFPDLSVSVEHLIEEGAKLACRWNATGTHLGAFHGVPPTKTRAVWSGTGFYGVDDGKIIVSMSNWDLFGLLNQLRQALR